MTKDIILYNSVLKWNIQNQFLKNSTVNFKPEIEQQRVLPEVLFITSYPPRECGIATYSQDLVNALCSQYEDSFNCSICALETDTEHHVYARQPKYILNTERANSFLKAAFQINNDEDIKLVVVQHEFGFFSSRRDEFQQFLEAISVPIVLVFHTVLPKPDIQLKLNVEAMAAIATSIIVMTMNSAKVLKTDYDIADDKISVIPHGTHLVPPVKREDLKCQYKLENRMILSTFGLLSSGKSIETALNALPAVIKEFPKIMFLVLGKTHPNVVKHEGEKYRLMLETKVKELKLEQHVRFVNEYLQLPILLEYLQLTDIYLFTSKDPYQAVSGTFSYAVSCGCPVISTPIPHAKEIISNDNGLLFDFENSQQLSAAILLLLKNEKLRFEISSNSIHKMAATTWQNSAISHALLFKEVAVDYIHLNYKIPKINLKHVHKMTTSFGMIQFSKIANPDIHSGYTIDDNARELIAICQHYKMYGDDSDLVLINTYIEFIKYCIQEDGLFLNYVNESREFTKQNYTENLDDSNGRTIWALGFVCSLKDILPVNVIIEVERLLRIAIPNLENIHSTRSMAFIIKGLHYQNRKENKYLLELFANRLVQMYKHETIDGWNWFEDSLTYGNSLLPEALLCAYMSTYNEEYKRIAVESFDFLLS